MLVGDVYVEYHRLNGHQEQVIQKQKSHAEVRMSNEVAMEVKCLKRKLGKDKQNCGTCSLINCSCQSDRVVAAMLAAVVLRPLQSMVERKIKKHSDRNIYSQSRDNEILNAHQATQGSQMISISNDNVDHCNHETENLSRNLDGVPIKPNEGGFLLNLTRVFEV
jgi:hypothetical protein